MSIADEDPKEANVNADAAKGKAEDRWPSVLLLTGAWACAMSVFASAVVTLSLAASPVAPPGAETLPLALALVFQGVANLVLPAEKRCLGLKGAYVLGAVIGFLGCGLVGLGCWVQQFGLQLFGAACMGFSLAHAQNYRFSAVLMLPSNPPKAIGVVLFGGVVGSMTGSAGFTQAKHMLPVEFAGIYVLGAGAHTVALVILACMSFPPVPGSTGDKARSLGQLLRQPRCAAAVLAMASSYGMMLVLMAPSPVVMQRFYSIPYVPNTLAMMGHMACMFSPSLITGSAVNRYGPMKVIMLGVLLGFSCALLLWWESVLWSFALGLALLGLCWNFMFLGGTAMLGSTHEASEALKLQAVADLIVFLTAAAASLASMPLVLSMGWHQLQLAVMGLAVTTALVLAVLQVLDKK